MQVKTKLSGGTLYIMLCGELDQHTALYTKQVFEKSISKGGFKEVIIDLADLNFMDSTGIGVLIGRYKLLKAKKVPVYICNANSTIEKIFKISGLYEIMPKIS